MNPFVEHDIVHVGLQKLMRELDEIEKSSATHAKNVCVKLVRVDGESHSLCHGDCVAGYG